MVSQKDQGGRTPLMYAAMFDHVDWIHHLVGLGAPLDTRCRSGMNALHWAVDRCNVASAAALLALGANVEAVTGPHSFSEGSSPLVIACMRGHTGMI